MSHGPLHSIGRRPAGGAVLLAPPPGGAWSDRPPPTRHESRRRARHEPARRPPAQHDATRRPPHEARRRARREPQRAMQLLMSGLGALIMMGICGLSAFFVAVDARHARSSPRSTPPVAAAVLVRDVSSRETDARPLTTAEVFPQQRITMVPGASPYRLRMRHLDTDCAAATIGAMAELLARSGCNQVVRGTLIAPVGGYPVTAGVFNLPDAEAARSVGRQAESLVDAGQGSFAGMAADGATRPVESSATQVSWHARGHYLIYCVIARPDGRLVRDDDPYAQRIVFDLVESYLPGTLLARGAPPPV